jgi:outer membrane lipoprotein carrier protein
MEKSLGTLIRELVSPRGLRRERLTLVKRPEGLLHVLSALLLTVFASQTLASQPTALPPILQEVEASYAKAGTLYAHFEQVAESAALKTKKKSAGDITIQRPNKLRWQTMTPDPNLLVSDGKHAWFYTPPYDPSERGQYTELPATKIQSKLASALLSGEFSENPGLAVKSVSDHEFVLTPKAGTAGTVSEARVEIDPVTKTITRVQLTHRDGNRADIHLSGIKLGDRFGDEVFVFKAPPNTDKMQPE